jgi:hypothetical protein
MYLLWEGRLIVNNSHTTTHCPRLLLLFAIDLHYVVNYVKVVVDGIPPSEDILRNLIWLLGITITTTGMLTFLLSRVSVSFNGVNCHCLMAVSRVVLTLSNSIFALNIVICIRCLLLEIEMYFWLALWWDFRLLGVGSLNCCTWLSRE